MVVSPQRNQRFLTGHDVKHQQRILSAQKHRLFLPFPVSWTKIFIIRTAKIAQVLQHQEAKVPVEFEMQKNWPAGWDCFSRFSSRVLPLQENHPEPGLKISQTDGQQESDMSGRRSWAAFCLFSQTVLDCLSLMMASPVQFIYSCYFPPKQTQTCAGGMDERETEKGRQWDGVLAALLWL